MLIVVAPSSSAICSTSAVYSTSARVASIGENSTSSTSERAWATAARAWPLTSSRGGELVLDVDVRRRDERVDAGALGVAYRPVGGIDVPHMNAGEPGDDRAL